jgi:YtkA-like
MRKTMFVALAIVTFAAASAFAAPKDYAFTAVSATVGKGDGVIVSIRLTKKGKPFAGAEIVKSEISMAPDGMEDMQSSLTPVPASEPGVYAFKTDLTMAGRWLLIVSAKIPDEPKPIFAKVVFQAK